MKKLKNGQISEMTPEEVAAFEASKAKTDAYWNQYDMKRRAEYPDLAEQLDMLYKDMKNGTTTWVDLIDSIKAKYPKP